VTTADRTADSTAGRTADEIAADIAETRNRLAGKIDRLVYRAHPKTIAKRQVESTKAKFVHADGSPDKDKITKIAGIALGVIVTIIVIRKLVG